MIMCERDFDVKLRNYLKDNILFHSFFPLSIYSYEFIYSLGEANTIARI